MALTKAKIYNLALGALLLSRQITDTETDTSNENTVLNTHWDLAFESVLEDLDLDSTSTTTTLELIEEAPNDYWDYAYKYPSDCLFFRRIESATIIDSRTTHIPKRIGMVGTQKTIFTNEVEATAEYISSDVTISSLTYQAGLAIAYKLAWFSSPLNVGKGAAALRKTLLENYVIAKTEAQEKDRNENFNFYDESVDSEFVDARTT